MAKTEEIHLPVSQLQKGITVKLPLSWTDHPFLFNKIEITSDAQIQMIQKLGVPYVILLSGTLKSAKSVNAPAPRVQKKSINQLTEQEQQARKHMRQSQTQFVGSINGIRGVLGKVVSDPEGAIREASVLVEAMLEQLYGAENVKLALVTSGEAHPTATQHGVSVAALSMMIAKNLQMSKPEIRTIATGALLHDIGKFKVPEAIRNKRGPLTVPEKNFIAMHPNYGYEMLKRSGLYGDDVLDIVLHHHEFVDGSGYPNGLKGDEISKTTQIVSLVNDYDSFLWRDEIASPQIALGYLFKTRSEQHSDELIQALVKILGIYPPGTLVKLTDNTFAKVVVTTDDVKHPQVWCCQPDGSKGHYRFLPQEDVSVDSVIKLEDLSEGARKTLRLNTGISFYFCHQ